MVDIAVPKKRGRPRKEIPTGEVPAAVKPIDATPKKRGRPKKSEGQGRPPEEGALSGTGRPRGRPRKDAEKNVQNAVVDVTEDKPRKRRRKIVRKCGRPRKHQPSDEEANDVPIVRRPVGRPSTGAVKFNIVRTGRKVGRPKTKKKKRMKEPPKEIILRLEIEPVYESELVSPPRKQGRLSL